MSPVGPFASVQKPHTCRKKVLRRLWQNRALGGAGSYLLSQPILSLRATTSEFPSARNTHCRTHLYSYFQGTYYVQQDKCKDVSANLKKRSELFIQRVVGEHAGRMEIPTISLLEKVLTGPAQDQGSWSKPRYQGNLFPQNSAERGGSATSDTNL